MKFVVSAESIDLAWVPLGDLRQYTEEEESILPACSAVDRPADR